MNDTYDIFPPDPPIIPAAKLKPRVTQAGGEANDDTTKSLDATAIRAAVHPDADTQPDAVFTADWQASAALHPDPLEAQLARKDAVIANLSAMLDLSEQRNHELLAANQALSAEARVTDGYELAYMRSALERMTDETLDFVAVRLLKDICKPWHERGYAWHSLHALNSTVRLGPLPMEMDKVVTRG